MGRDLYEGSVAARGVFDAADEAVGFGLSKLCFEGPEQELRRTEIQQPAILTTSIAVLRALEEKLQVPAAYVAGHSLGEYSALVAAGSLAADAAAALVNARGRFMQEAVPAGQGAMAAIMGAAPDVITAACREAAAESGEVVSPANYNSPQQTVIAGTSAAVEKAIERAKAAGAKKAVALPVSAPFHCALMQPAAEKLASELATVTFATPRVPIVTNVEAEPNSDETRIPSLLERQVTAPVRFAESVERLVALGVTRVLELGPGRVLSGLVARIDRSLVRHSASDMEQVAEVADQLASEMQ